MRIEPGMCVMTGTQNRNSQKIDSYRTSVAGRGKTQGAHNADSWETVLTADISNMW